MQSSNRLGPGCRPEDVLVLPAARRPPSRPFPPFSVRLLPSDRPETIAWLRLVCPRWLCALAHRPPWRILADRQLARFRADPANKGKVCQAGLWNYSRHPNYFFEWLVWVGYAVFALGSPWGWLGLIAPALMLHFLLNVTGIPMTEELSLKSKGDAYRAYQRTTSAFVPWFKKV